MSSRPKRPTWFKLFLHQKALVCAVSDEVAGKAIKACFEYFDSGEVIEMDSTTFAVFSAIKPYIDESYNDYWQSVENGRLGGNTRWHGDE